MLAGQREGTDARIPTPSEFLGFEVGADRTLADYHQIVSYFRSLDASSDRVEVEVLGKTTLGVAAMAMNAVTSANPDEYWCIPLEGQRDPVTAVRLASLLVKHGVEVFLTADKKSFLVPSSQPYNRFVDEMMGIQRYPEVKPGTGSGILEPYDVTAWSLPLLMGVKAEKLQIAPAEQKAATKLQNIPWPGGGLSGTRKYYSIAGRQNNIYALSNGMQRAGGEVFIEPKANDAPAIVFADHPQLRANAEKLHLLLQARPDLPAGAIKLKAPRIGLYKPYIASIDEGWTRFILDQYGYSLKNIENREMKSGNLNAAFDVIILPDSTRQVIVDGKTRSEGYYEEFPPEFVGGIGREGVKALSDFVNQGGTLITLADSFAVLTGEDFNLPVRNTFAGGGTSQVDQVSAFNIPGSLLRINVDVNHPVGYGVPAEIAGFYDGSIAFETSPPAPDVRRSVVAWYPSDAKDILLSGYAKGAERLERKAAIVSFSKGKGKIVIFGFRVQFRAQTEGTFQMLFNAIHWGAIY